ncbi:MAG TPA: tRNA (N6-threonylcarbamoyladenosine(37)-N6)-methyltransferase TrmO [Thermoanaerobaculia bacterium]|nr:tRNA (N6-threonylcarbamoyladenosine(37)-N6)-methyltransferase TrmO [Thermoanaerobaculia bacterium]HUM31206.1 tRNA (N6-threonylcarbamoyladenosine(37)-N6)-methyltransferase TrmO [Thermoanaerobaculia bacterium]HXK69558.1 tRNA (N6-threonylcarbamoyladenosine(37)-N6)-methyltransferase TrmO [Thermoanaerobaculia bacterium]
MSDTNFVFHAIGVVRSPHTDPSRTPIQPVFARGVRGTVILDLDYMEGLADLDGFSHIYLLYVFDRAEETLLTVKPFLDDAARGIFATRSPLRPNKIGISLVRLVSIEENVLTVEDVDILDGTPLLDIKPYVARFETREDVRSGWQDKVSDDAAYQRGRRGFRRGRDPEGEDDN